MPVEDNTLVVFSYMSYLVSFVLMCSNKTGDFKIASVLIYTIHSVSFLYWFSDLFYDILHKNATLIDQV